MPKFVNLENAIVYVQTKVNNEDFRTAKPLGMWIEFNSDTVNQKTVECLNLEWNLETRRLRCPRLENVPANARHKIWVVDPARGTPGLAGSSIVGSDIFIKEKMSQTISSPPSEYAFFEVDENGNPK